MEEEMGGMRECVCERERVGVAKRVRDGRERVRVGDGRESREGERMRERVGDNHQNP